jgi:hypothetical protein
LILSAIIAFGGKKQPDKNGPKNTLCPVEFFVFIFSGITAPLWKPS